MMYDREKSDPAIVAVKPTNKAGQPAAELVEPRAGAVTPFDFLPSL
jgi:RNA-directed DNA polymerase